MNTREKVLKVLEEEKGSFISGEKLAQELDVSRNSVWKAVRDLRELGYSIDSVTNRGYRLSSLSDIISSQGIGVYLNHKEIVSDIEVYDELSSTSTLAKEKAVIDSSDRKIIVARRQTAGKGHGQKSFSSPDGGIYLSIIIKPDIMKGINLPLFAAVAVSDVLDDEAEPESEKEETKNKATGIQWINSLYMGDKKICGILTESISDMETGEISSYIVGIGINCILKDKNKIIADIINRILYPQEYYKYKDITNKYKSKLMYVNKRVKFTLYGEKREEFYAVILGMDKNGRLTVKKDDGSKVCLEKGYMTL